MFFIIYRQPLCRCYPAWAVVMIGLAVLSPSLIIHVSASTIRVSWAEVLAETSSANAGKLVLTLDNAIKQALLGNPGLGQIKARAEAMAAIPSQAGTLPDPTVNIGLLNVPTSSFDLHKEDMTMLWCFDQKHVLYPATSVKPFNLRLHSDISVAFKKNRPYQYELKDNLYGRQAENIKAYCESLIDAYDKAVRKTGK